MGYFGSTGPSSNDVQIGKKHKLSKKVNNLFFIQGSRGDFRRSAESYIYWSDVDGGATIFDAVSNHAT